MSARIAVLCGVVAWGCSPQPPMNPCHASSEFVIPTEPIAFVGVAVMVELAVPFTCADSVQVTARTSVVGPDNLPVTPTNGSMQTVQSGLETGSSTTVAFVPSQPGPYHLTAQFEPNLGTAQMDVGVVTDRRAEPPKLTVPATAPLLSCTRFDVTPGMNILCLSPLGVYSGVTGQPLQSFDQTLMGANAGGVLWTYGAALTRMVEQSDGGFEATPAASLPTLNDQFAVLVPAATELVLAEKPQDFSFIALQPDAGFDARSLVRGPPSWDGLWRDGDALLFVGPGLICADSLDAGVSRCRGGVGDASAVSVDGIWGISNNDLLLQTVSGDKQLTIPGTYTLHAPQGLPTWNTVPWVMDSSTVLLPRHAQGIQLEVWPLATQVLEATDGWLIETDGGQVAFYQR